MDFNEWFDHGRQQGWISEISCAAHDGIPMTVEESEMDFDDLADACQFIIRLWP